MNFWQIAGIVVNTALVILALFLWRLAMEPVEDKILEIRSKAREDNTTVKPWIASMAQSRFWFVIAMALAPLLVIGYGIFILVAVLWLEAWAYISEDLKSLQKRALRR